MATDPESALRRARRWLSRTGPDTEARALARHVSGLASIERGLLDDGDRHTRLGLAVARRLGMRDLQVRLRLTLAWLELERGRMRACRAQLRAVRPLLRPEDRPRLAWVRGLLHSRRGRHAKAVAELSSAVRGFEQAGEPCRVASALLERGLARLAGGLLDEADSDLERATRTFTAQGGHERAAYCTHSRGNVALRAGRLSRALRLHSESVTAGVDDRARPELRAERAEVLARLGRTAEARAELERAATNPVVAGAGRLAGITLVLAECDLRDGAFDSALARARWSRRWFRSRSRPVMACRARAVEWRARLAARRPSRYALTVASVVAARCAAHGRIGDAVQLRVACGRAAADEGSLRTARARFVAAARHRDDRALPVPVRATAWAAAAMAAEVDGARQRVLDACEEGWRLIAEYAASVPTADLCGETSQVVERLTGVALRAAVDTGDADVVLRWSERCRPATPRRDSAPESAHDLHRAVSRLRDAVAGTRTHDPRTRSTGTGVAVLESHVRDAAMLRGRPSGSVPQEPDPNEVARAVDGRVLVSFFTLGGQVHSLSIVDGRGRLARHGSEGEIGAIVDRLRYCLQRRARANDPWVAETFAAGAEQASGALQRALLPHLRGERLRDSHVIVVPTGPLHGLPWASLPLLRGVPVTVSPSLTCWSRAREQAERATHRQHPVWVSGPGPEHADQEVRGLHAAAGGRLLTGPTATTRRVLNEIDGAATVHIAAHGRFRADHPQLSCLDLADGPLYGYDLDRLVRGPTTVVLSACEVGQSAAVEPGEGVTGPAAALLGRGTATVIAGVVTVPDERTARVMVDLHDGLRRGRAPASALAEAQQRHGESGFVCLGYGGGDQP